MAAQTVAVRRAAEKDLPDIAWINRQAFAGNRGSVQAAEDWVRCWLRAFPLYQYFVAEREGILVAYIGWQMHGGFCREEAVIELEQLAVDSRFWGTGIGSLLIRESVPALTDWVSQTNAATKEITFSVWPYTLNHAGMKTYEQFFEDGVMGMRLQYGDRAESMLRRRILLHR